MFVIVCLSVNVLVSLLSCFCINRFVLTVDVVFCVCDFVFNLFLICFYVCLLVLFVHHLVSVFYFPLFLVFVHPMLLGYVSLSLSIV